MLETDGGSGGEAPRTYENGRQFRGRPGAPRIKSNLFCVAKLPCSAREFRFLTRLWGYQFNFSETFLRLPPRVRARRNEYKSKSQVSWLRQQIRLAAHLPSCDGQKEPPPTPPATHVRCRGCTPAPPLTRKQQFICPTSHRGIWLTWVKHPEHWPRHCPQTTIYASPTTIGISVKFKKSDAHRVMEMPSKSKLRG